MYRAMACPAGQGRRRCLACACIAVGGLLLLRGLVFEPYQVPTGSMAPYLLGHHRTCACPRCGFPVVVGRHGADADGQGGPRRYGRAFCPNCGQQPVPVGEVEETAGDRVLVRRVPLRAPRRWEVLVFRLFGLTYIKRLVGLPGERIAIHDGDVYIDGQLARKTLAEARAMCLPVFDQSYQPPTGWAGRWEGNAAPALDGRHSPDRLTYRNELLDEGKCEPIGDECSYNGGLHAGRELVHDFLVETAVQVDAGAGTLTLRLCDGHDWVEAVVPVATAGEMITRACPDSDTEPGRVLATTAGIALRPGRTYRVELAFVDRRFSMAIDGRLLVQADLSAPGPRSGVARPFELRAEGVAATLREFRLYRDVHYSQAGCNAVRGESVQLRVDQYFVLGDNSVSSEDSRFWPEQGAVPAENLVGVPLLAISGTALRWLR